MVNVKVNVATVEYKMKSKPTSNYSYASGFGGQEDYSNGFGMGNGISFSSGFGNVNDLSMINNQQ